MTEPVGVIAVRPVCVIAVREENKIAEAINTVNTGRAEDDLTLVTRDDFVEYKKDGLIILKLKGVTDGVESVTELDEK